MKKKFLALVLTLAMVLSLVPATALATGATQEGNNQGPVEVTGSDNDKNLTMKKTVTPVQNQDGTYQDGTYTVCLESYATGEVTNTTTTKSSDIVLLLDVSGSMSDPYATKDTYSLYDGYNNYWLKYYSTTHWGLWYKIDANTYVPVSVDKEDYFGSSNDKYTYSYIKDGKKEIIEESTGGYTQPTTQFYYKTDANVTKMDALKEAVNAFIDDVAEKSPTSQISIVKFAGEESSDIGDNKYRDGSYIYNYTQVVKNLTQVNSSGATELKNAVSALEAAGATSSDYGLKKAQDVLNKATQEKVIILFTDGEPNHDSNFDYEVATDAVNTAKTLKQANATIYTVGVFKDPSERINQYMSSVSSNYPKASATATNNGKNWAVTNGGSKVGGHYINAENAADLIKAFQTISSEVSSTPLNASAVVVDKVPSNFKAPANKEDVTLKVANYKADGTFDTPTDAPSTIHASVNTDGTVSVTGFDFSENWCGLKGGNPHGQKLIIEFTIKCTNYGGTQPTNAGAYIKAGKVENEEPIISLKDPTVPVTISLGIPEAELNEKLGVSSQKEYNGSGIPILSALSDKANTLVNGINNAYVDMELTIAVDEANTYVYRIQAGKQSGDWYQNNQKMTPEAVSNVKTSQNVNRGENNAVESYIYNFDLKLSDATPRGADPAEYQNNTASFKITPRNVTLTSATASKEYDGTPLTNDKITEGGDGFVEGEGATYTVTGSQTKVGESTNTFTYTLNSNTKESNYNITATYGKLTITERAVVHYTVIFDATEGSWNDTTVDGYTVSENKKQASRNDFVGTDRITATSITSPVNPGKLLDGWGYYINGQLTKIDQINYASPFNPTVLGLYDLVNPQKDPENTVTLYAIWKDDTTPDGPLTYTINQHYMRNAEDADHVEIKDLTSEQETQISTLIAGKDTNLDWRDAHGSTAHYIYDGQKTTVTVPGQSAQPYNANDTLDVTGTVIDLYYYLDNWKDGDTKNPSEDDSKTDGDGIPDYKQILIEYKAHTPLVGEVSREFEIQTLKDNQTVATPTGAIAKAKKDSVYAFAYWIKGEVDPEKTEAEIENTAICYKNQLSGVTINPVTRGGTYTYTAIFLEDKLGGGDNKDQPDGIPDRYQVTIIYKSSDESRGKISDASPKKEVLTITDKDGNRLSSGKVEITGASAEVTGSRCYFSNWTNDDNQQITTSATLGQQTIEKAEGGKTYTFTANFGRSSGGHSGGGTVTIPDDVPTGLNGKDHYAYVVGYPDGMVYPQKNITRAEVATIFFRLLTDETREANMTKSNSYNDMKDGAWYTCAVSTLSKMGIIKGYEDGSFKPDASISRAEFAAIAARFDPDGDKTPATFSDVSSHWAKDEISIAANHGWIKGYEDGSFKPDQKITRAETMTLVNRVLKRLPETKDDLHKDMKTWPDNQNESAWFYLAVQEATNSHYQKLKKDGTHETWESMRETRDWAALEK